MNTSTLLKKKHGKLFFILSFIITWTAGFYLVYQSRTSGDKSIVVLLIAYMGPFIAALLTMAITRDWEAFKDFLRRLFRVKGIKLLHVPIILFLMPASMVVAILISMIFGQPAAQLSLASELQVFDDELILSMVILAFVPVLEELGWRGYGVDALRSNRSLLKSSLLFGLIWGMWHLPVFFIEGSYQASLWAMNPIFAINFFVGILPLAVIMNWLYFENNRSILVASVFHIAVNYASELFSANQVSKTIMTTVLIGIACIIVIKNKDTFVEVI